MNLDKGVIISLLVVLATLLVGGYMLSTKKGDFLSRIKNIRGEVKLPQLSLVELKFGEKNIKIDSSTYSKESLINILVFDGSQSWQGDGEIDDTSYREKSYSLLMESRDNFKKEGYLLQRVNLSKYQIFELAVNLQSDPDDLELVRLYFGNKDKSAYYQYPLTNLTVGWNFLKIPKIKFSAVNAALGKTATASGFGLGWDNIDRIGLEVNSRLNSAVTINFGELVGFESDDYQNNWLTSNPSFLGLAKNKEGNIALQARNVGTSVALIKRVGGISDFTLKAKILPLKPSARSGLFARGDYKTGYGYYFLIDGVTGNRWQIAKAGLVDKSPKLTILKDGLINNFKVEANRPLFVKAEARGSELKFFLSPDGQSFTLLGNVNDSEFKTGGAGIAVLDSGLSQFDEIELNQ